MNRQRKVVITVTYNEMGIIIDTKAEELDLSAQPNLQPTCNQLATDCISRQAAIDAFMRATADGDKAEWCEYIIRQVPSAQPERKTGRWIPCSERMPETDGKYLCCWQGKSVETGMFLNGHFRLYGEIKDNLVTAWMPLPKPWKEE